MVLGLMFFQLITSSAAVVAEVTLEWFVVQVESFMPNQVALLHETLAARGTCVRADSHVTTHVASKLAPFRSRIITVHKLTFKYVACVQSLVGDEM